MTTTPHFPSAGRFAVPGTEKLLRVNGEGPAGRYVAPASAVLAACNDPAVCAALDQLMAGEVNIVFLGEPVHTTVERVT